MTGYFSQEGASLEETLQRAAAVEAPPRPWLAVELVTDAFRLAGSLKLPIGQGRLVDLLNFREEAVVILQDVEVERLDNRSEEASRCPLAYVRKEAIVLAIPEEEHSSRAWDQRPLEYAPKEPHRARFLLPSFTVVGNFHLPKGADISSARWLQTSGFVPLTDAEAIYLPDPATVWRAAVIVLNAGRAEACLPAPGLLPRQAS